MKADYSDFAISYNMVKEGWFIFRYPCKKLGGNLLYNYKGEENTSLKASNFYFSTFSYLCPYLNRDFTFSCIIITLCPTQFQVQGN